MRDNSISIYILFSDWTVMCFTPTTYLVWRSLPRGSRLWSFASPCVHFVSDRWLFSDVTVWFPQSLQNWDLKANQARSVFWVWAPVSGFTNDWNEWMTKPLFASTVMHTLQLSVMTVLWLMYVPTSEIKWHLDLFFSNLRIGFLLLPQRFFFFCTVERWYCSSGCSGFVQLKRKTGHVYCVIMVLMYKFKMILLPWSTKTWHRTGC